MLIKKGSKGDDVKRVQRALGLSADGIFGSGTEKSVKEFQSKKGLVADGIVGPSTLAMMIEEPDVQEMDLSKLKGHIPDEVIEQIPETIETFKIHTPLRLAHFLAQCGHESAGFKATEENLNYSSKALQAVFGKYFNEETAEEYHRKPEMIANKVYANRMDNGDEQSGDGWKYRGRGYIQLTGKHNYSKFNESVEDDVVEKPELVKEKYPLLSAAWFWSSNNLNRLSDLGSSDDIVTKVTKRVNGGTIGLEDRIKHFHEYYQLII
jgi:putative chitinase